MSGSTFPVVAIIGRPNVGKSALFNRLIQRRQSLVDATPGLTRDRLYGDVNWRGVHFRIVDTGGLQFARSDKMAQAIGEQVSKAMAEAQMALFVCDGRQGVMPLDTEVASWVRRWGKPVVVIVNKVDNPQDMTAIHEFTRFGMGPAMPISSLHGLRVGELLEAIVDRLQQMGVDAPAGSKAGSSILKIAIVGRPNVGKSSLVNRLLNEERVVVSDVPGTTRDPVDTFLEYRGDTYCLIDTAGIRAQRKLKSRIDAVARMKAMDEIHRADVCLVLVDAAVGLIQDDLKLLDQVIQAGRSFCLVLNKCDLLARKPNPQEIAAAIVRKAPFVRFAPVVCISAKTGFNVLQVLEGARTAATAAHRKLNSAEAKQLLEVIQTDSKAPVAVRHSHLFRLIQVRFSPPTFHLLGRAKQAFKQSDMAYLERIFRRELKWEGTPIQIRLLMSSK